MDFKIRNKKVAIARWKKIMLKELSRIPNDKESLLKKAAICGFLAGDGSVQIRKEKSFYHHQIDFFADNKKMLKVYLEFIKSLYNKKPSVALRDNVQVARLSHKFIVTDLLKECRFGLKKWNFPKRLFKIKGAKEVWLKAFFSAEGYVNNKVIKIQSVNINGIKNISKLLFNFGIRNNFYEYKPKNLNHSVVGLIFINDLESRKIFYEKIGFWHSKKEKVLKEVLGL